jgi:tocopherol cyclase
MTYFKIEAIIEILSKTRLIPARLRSVWKPSLYHGHGRKHDFFEGWYFKMVDASEKHAWAVIPGVFLSSSKSSDQESHAFIQTLNGNTGESRYFKFPIEEFEASTREFDVRIGPNRFCSDSIRLDIRQADQTLNGTLRFKKPTPWPVTVLSPGIMGWFAYVPFMECYHGIVSLDHTVEGNLNHNGMDMDFKGGRGYMEKDWGRAFPRCWVWMQTNHFTESEVSLTASVARIPWLFTAFRGFIVGLLHRGRLYRFATYTGARLINLDIKDKSVHLVIQDGQYRLAIDASRSEGGLLHAPFSGAMLKRVMESLTAEVSVKLTERKSDAEIFSGTGRHAGLEIGGEPDCLEA